jgi:hypothetical protein
LPTFSGTTVTNQNDLNFWHLKIKLLTFSGTTITNQNCIHEEIKSKLSPRNAWYLSVQNLLPQGNLKIYITVTLYVRVVLFALKLGLSR